MNTNYDLVNRKCSITVSEPWDLGEALNRKPFDVTVMKQGIHPSDAFAPESEAVICKLESLFEFKGMSYRYILLLPRREHDCFGDLVNSNREITCSGVRITQEQVDSNAPFNLDWWRGGGVFEGILKFD